MPAVPGRARCLYRVDLDLDAVGHLRFGNKRLVLGPVVLVFAVAALGRGQCLAPDDCAVLVEYLELPLHPILPCGNFSDCCRASLPPACFGALFTKCIGP